MKMCYIWIVTQNIMEQPKVERTLRLMQLMSGNAYLTVEQLAKRLDTSSRSIYRYIDSFKACGFAVEKVEGAAGLIHTGIILQGGALYGLSNYLHIFAYNP